MADDIEVNLPRNYGGPIAAVGDLIHDPSTQGFAVITYIGPPTKGTTWGITPTLSFKCKRVCDHHFNTFKNSKEREFNVSSLPNKITKDQFDDIKAGIAMLESHIK
jgi:hypothetical protein